MKTPETTFNQATLINLLTTAFAFNLARTKCLALIILALIEARSVNLARIAGFCNSKTALSSRYRRLQRFVQQVSFPPCKLAPLLLRIMGINPTDKLILILDRTNWKFGKKDCNILYLAAAYQGIAIPLFYSVLKDKKRGNSDYKDRINLLKQYLAAFGSATIECVLGDREFIGKNWIEWLDQQQIPYVLRIKENGQYIGRKNGKMLKAASLFKSLPVGQVKHIGKRKLGKTDPYWAHISAIKSTTNQLVVLLHSSHIQQPCQLYHRRWEIELLFKVLKSSGFDLEATHISDEPRLGTLLAIVSISCCFAYRVGIYYVQLIPTKVKKHGYKPLNTVRFGLDLLIDLLRGNCSYNPTTYYHKKIKPLLLTLNSFFAQLKLFVV